MHEEMLVSFLGAVAGREEEDLRERRDRCFYQEMKACCREQSRDVCTAF